MSRKKAVISADPAALADVEALVREGKYATVSEFVREAMADRLTRIREARIAEQVARYCAGGGNVEDDDSPIAGQAFPGDEDS